MKKFLRAFACVSTLVLLSFMPTHGQTISGANQVQGTTPTNQNVQGNPVWIGGWDGTKVQGLKTDGSGNLVSTSSAADTTASGTISASGTGNAVCIALASNYGAQVTLTGTWTATVQAALKAADGSTIINTIFLDPPTMTTSGTVNSNTSQAIVVVGGSTSACVYASAFTSGPINVSLRATTSQTLADVVKATNFPTTVDTNSGTAGASTLRVVPSTSTPADATSNTSIPGPQSYNMIFNGATWDRLKGITGQTGLLAVGVVNSGTTLSDGMSSGQFATYLDNGGSARQFGSMPMLFNGSTVDRARDSGATGAMDVSIRPTSASAMGIAPVVSAAVESNHVIKASAGNLYSGYVTTGATAGFLMVFNTTTAPADGVVTPAACYQAPANTTTSFSFNGPPSVFSTGITFVFSSTGCFTKTASATAYFSGSAQ